MLRNTTNGSSSATTSLLSSSLRQWRTNARAVINAISSSVDANSNSLRARLYRLQNLLDHVTGQARVNVLDKLVLRKHDQFIQSKQQYRRLLAEFEAKSAERSKCQDEIQMVLMQLNNASSSSSSSLSSSSPTTITTTAAATADHRSSSIASIGSSSEEEEERYHRRYVELSSRLRQLKHEERAAHEAQKLAFDRINLAQDFYMNTLRKRYECEQQVSLKTRKLSAYVTIALIVFYIVQFAYTRYEKHRERQRHQEIVSTVQQQADEIRSMRQGFLSSFSSSSSATATSADPRIEELMALLKQLIENNNNNNNDSNNNNNNSLLLQSILAAVQQIQESQQQQLQQLMQQFPTLRNHETTQQGSSSSATMKLPQQYHRFFFSFSMHNNLFHWVSTFIVSSLATLASAVVLFVLFGNNNNNNK